MGVKQTDTSLQHFISESKVGDSSMVEITIPKSLELLWHGKRIKKLVDRR